MFVHIKLDLPAENSLTRVSTLPHSLLSTWRDVAASLQCPMPSLANRHQRAMLFIEFVKCATLRFVNSSGPVADNPSGIKQVASPHLAHDGELSASFL